jgi:chemotaxis protein methyltransferase CheR
MTGRMAHSSKAGSDLTPSYPFSAADFATIARIAHAEFGLHLTEQKRDLVYSRLTKRLRALGLRDFAAYCALLDSPRGEAERTELLSALTTNVTHFFRENHHFATLRDEALPRLVAAARKGERIRLWSAGCSAGPEPYSMAMTILEAYPDAANLDLLILATDIDPQILDRAQEGRYTTEELANVPVAMRHKFFEKPGPNETTQRAGAALRALIRFRSLNLIADWPMRGPFDVIFCRNVAIYFDKSTQSQLWSRFADHLKPEGWLFVGHSERLQGPAADTLVSCGVTTYRHTTQRAAA